MMRRVEHLSQRLDRVGEQLRTRDRSIARQKEHLSRLSMRLDSARNAQLNKPRTHVATLHARYAQSLTQRMAFTPSASRVTAIDSRLQSSMQALLDVRSSALARLSQALTLLNPDGVLERGYAMVLDADHRVVTQADDVEVGDALTVRLRRGSLKVGVERRDP
jgi:exodeoxyribonuclease VII large subunit